MSYTYKNKSFNDIVNLAYYIWCEDNRVEYVKKTLNKREREKVFSFIYNRYGRSGLSKYKDKTEKDFKRKIIDLENVSHPETLLELYKNKNVKFHYKCKKCNKDVYTAYSTYIRFKDSLCKGCRNEIRQNKVVEK